MPIQSDALEKESYCRLPPKHRERMRLSISAIVIACYLFQMRAGLLLITTATECI